jgi:membrane protein implicated in regulation of membrane protease activity
MSPELGAPDSSPLLAIEQLKSGIASSFSLSILPLIHRLMRGAKITVMATAPIIIAAIIIKLTIETILFIILRLIEILAFRKSVRSYVS